MDSEPKAEDVKESEVSRFTLDGVVAELVIEVDEEPDSPSKTLSVNGLENYEALKASALRKSSVVLDTIDDTENEQENDSAKNLECSTDLKSEDKPSKYEKDSSAECATKCVKDEQTEDGFDKDSEDGKHGNLKEQPEICDEKQSEENEKEKKKKEEQTKRSSKRAKAKNVVDKESVNQSSRDDQIKEVLSEPESKRKILRNRSQTNAAKSMPTRAAATIETKNAEKSVTAQEIIKRGQKRKIEGKKSKIEESAKKQKQTEIAPEVKPSLKSNKSTVSKASTSRRQTLRKPASVASTTVKPKAYNLYPQNDCKLDSYVEVKEQLKVADLKYLRALYRIMYDRWPPKDLEELKKEVLEFQGFAFKRKSDELEKRQNVLKKLPDASVSAICKILDLKEGTKDNMITDIIKFLLKPVKVIYSVVDPFEPSMQPVVKLEKITLERNDSDRYVHSVANLEDEIKKATKISKRKKFPSSRLSEYVSGKEMLTSETRTPDSSKVLDSTKTEPAKKKGRPFKKAAESDKNQDDVPAKKMKGEASKTVAKKSEKQPVLNTRSTRNKAAKAKNSKASVESTKEDESVTSVEIKEELEDKHDVPREAPEIEEDEDKPELSALEGEETLIPHIPEDSLDDITLSSDETKEQLTKQSSPKKKKVVHKRSGKPLRSFSTIKDNILNANFSALQRLHILLFGASDKVENLKTNILSFGGFPFLVGSEDWKQKEFLLSLLAQNTLKEYLNLLCIEHGDDDNHTLINKLMVFLAAPKLKGLEEEIITQVVSSEPVSNAPVQETTGKGRSVLKKATKPSKGSKPVVVPERRGPRYRKVLMDEEQVRRLENDFAREQRILEREKRQLQKNKLLDELIAEKNDSKTKFTKIKYCQAANCQNNSKDNTDLSFFIFPTDPVRLGKWLSNIELKPPDNKTSAFRKFLCSKHFDVRAFSNTCKNARLLRFAVPTIPGPGSNQPIKYPCLDGYSSPGGSRLKHVPSPSKKTEVVIKADVIKKTDVKKTEVVKKNEPPNSSFTMSIDVDTIPKNDEPKKSKSPIKSSASQKQAPLQKLLISISPENQSKNSSISAEIGDMTKKRASLMAQQTDSELLDALLQTVYKRRALKSAGAVISIPNKGVHTRLGELDNVKFLVVTANYNDLDVLHHLIYMTEASKSRVRKNILDFAGFNFAEDSTPYKDRMEFLKSLGYDISKRIGFLLGLCPYKMDIPQQDLNELIMYFLMSPCKSKQVPIRQLPHNFFGKDMPKELCLLLQKHSESCSSETSPNKTSSPEQTSPIASVSSTDADSPPIVQQKAKKSFKSSSLTKRVPAYPTLQDAPRNPLMVSPRGRPPANKRPFQMPNILSKPPPTTEMRPPPLQKSILKPPAVVVNSPKATPQEFLIQQQTPDGQQKTYKLIKLPASHPLNSAIKAPAVQSQLLPQLQSNIPIAGPPLPPGIIVFKNNPAATNLQGAVNPIPQLSSALQNVTMVNPELTITPVLTDASIGQQPAVPATSDEDTPFQLDLDQAVEELNPLEDSEPTDEELYSSIQEIIHNSNFEDITLRNVIDRVSAQYAAFNLKQRHSFMKECVKKIIIGT